MSIKWIISLLILLVLIIAGLGLFYKYETNKELVVPNANGTNDEACGQGGCVSDTFEYGTKVGQIFEDTELTDFEGNTVDLYDLMKGYDTTVIMLEADWCLDCQRQTDKLLKDNAAQEKVLFIPVYTTYSKEGNPLKEARYDDTKKYVERTYKDSDVIPYWDQNNYLWNKYGGYGTPTNIVLDKNAKIKDISLANDYDTLLLPNTESIPYKQI